MQSAHSHSTEKENRSATYTNGNNKATRAAAYPAVSGVNLRRNKAQRQRAIQLAPDTAQLFKKGIISNESHLVAEDDGMAVRAAGCEEFLAKESVSVVAQVFNFQDKFEDYIHCKINTSYESDCGIYADNLMRRIASFERKKEIAGKETVNIEGGPISQANPESLFQQTIASKPAPSVGQAYLIVNDKNDPEFGKKPFNFHWGTVIAKSGSDVMTAETGSYTKSMKFDMYSQSDLSQSFQQRYMDANKLAETAKTFQVNFTKTNK